MKYELNVTDKAGNLIEVVKGDVVDEVLRRAAKLTTKDFLGYYYEKERMMMNSCNELARTITDGIKKKLDDELKIFNLKSHTLPEVSWELLLNNFYDQNPQPVKGTPPSLPSLEKIPPQPNMNDSYYQYKFSLKDGMIPFRKNQIVEKLRAEFQRDYLVWEKKKDSIEARNTEKINDYEQKLKSFEDDYAKLLGDWIEKKSEIADRARTFKEGYQNLKSFAVEKYCELVMLYSSTSGFNHQRKSSLKYVEDTKFLFVEYIMPSKNELSAIREIGFSSESGKFEEVKFSEKEINERYQSILLQIVFRSLYELFHQDKSDALNEITFRGTVIPEGEGPDSKHSIPIISFTISKNDFMKINFGEGLNLDACFRINGGVFNLEIGKTNHRQMPVLSPGNVIRNN